MNKDHKDSDYTRLFLLVVSASVVLVLFAVFHVGAQQPKVIVSSDAPVISDKTALAIRTEQLALTQLNAQISAVTAKYQRALENDADYKRLNELMAPHVEAFNAATKGVCGTDPKAWVLDYDKLICKKPEAQPSPTK
jgi:hypothetical protein